MTTYRLMWHICLYIVDRPSQEATNDTTHLKPPSATAHLLYRYGLVPPLDDGQGASPTRGTSALLLRSVRRIIGNAARRRRWPRAPHGDAAGFVRSIASGGGLLNAVPLCLIAGFIYRHRVTVWRRSSHSGPLLGLPSDGTEPLSCLFGISGDL